MVYTPYNLTHVTVPKFNRKYASLKQIEFQKQEVRFAMEQSIIKTEQSLKLLSKRFQKEAFLNQEIVLGQLYKSYMNTYGKQHE